jgi:hypothetical protein
VRVESEKAGKKYLEETRSDLSDRNTGDWVQQQAKDYCNIYILPPVGNNY